MRDKRTPALEDDDLMPFGMHKDKRLQNVPAKYLLWLWDSNCSHKELDNYLWNNLEVLCEECEDYILGRKK